MLPTYEKVGPSFKLLLMIGHKAGGIDLIDLPSARKMYMNNIVQIMTPRK